MHSSAPVASVGNEITKKYWTSFNVTLHHRFQNAEESLEYFHWRNAQYFNYIELMPVAGFDDCRVLDFGCGPGHDLIGFTVYSRTKHLIGADISPSSLSEAEARLKLHNSDAQLILLDPTAKELPFENCTFDHIHSSGVLHHTPNPAIILDELFRILRPNGTANVMVYNYNSLWLHLFVSYHKQIIEQQYTDLSLREAFAKTTDGDECPIANCYTPQEFIETVKRHGFDAEFRGAAISMHELNIAPRRFEAISHRRLPEESRRFLLALETDKRGYPVYQGHYAGIDGCYQLRKPPNIRRQYRSGRHATPLESEKVDPLTRCKRGAAVDRRPLRILAIGYSSSVHVVNRVRCFAERGHEVFLLSEAKSGIDGVTELVPSAPRGQDEWVNKFVDSAGRLLRRDVPVPADMLRLALNFRRLINRTNPDVVHVHYAYAMWAWMAAVLGVRPLIVSVMGGDVLFKEQGAPTPRGIRLTKRLLQAADLITAKSNFLIGALDELGGYRRKAIRVVWGVDPERFKPLDAGALRADLGLAPDARIVLSPKIMSPFYNTHVIVEAMARVVESEPNARLVITELGATPEYRRELQTRIDDLSLGKFVKFVGAIPHERMAQFYNLADVAVGIPHSDGLPQTLLEAMACGVPNVIGRLERYGEIVRDRESAVFADITPHGVSEAVLELLHDPVLHRRIAEQGRRVVIEQANFPRDVGRVEDEYYRLVSRWRMPRVPRPAMLSDAALYWLGR